MRLSSFIAKRFLQSSSKGHTRPMIRLGIAAISLCVWSIIVSVCVLSGFKKEISQKVFGFGAHISIYAYQYDPARPASLKLPEDLTLWLQKDIRLKNARPFASKAGLLQSADENYGILLKGISHDYDTDFWHSKLVRGRLPKYTKEKNSSEILISQTIAQKLDVKSGQKIRAYFADGENMRERAFQIVGIYETGLDKFDQSIVLGDIKQVQRLNYWSETEVEGLEIELYEPSDMSSFYHDLENLLPYECIAYTVYERYPDIFGWLELTDMNVIVLFIILSLVAAMSLVSILFILVMEKTQYIGLWMSLGAKPQLISSIFIKQSLYMAIIGLLIGNLFAFICCFLQYHFHIIQLDQAMYFISHIPIGFPYLVIGGVNLAFLGVSALFIWFSSRVLSKLKPIDIL